MDSQHHGEEAELYVLGTLSDAERTAFEAHLAQCATCLARVGEAEATLAALEAHRRPVEPPPELRARFVGGLRSRARVAPWLAIAAAFLIGLLPSAPLTYVYLSAHRTNLSHGDATLALLNSHFAHAQFAAESSAVLPPSKVLFARDGAWLYIVVGAPHVYDVDAVSQGRTIPIGHTSVMGETSELFSGNVPPHVQAVILRDGSAIVGRARVLESVAR